MAAKKSKGVDRNKALIRGLVALSVVLNVVLITGVMVAAAFVKSDNSTLSILNYLVSNKLDERGCIATDAQGMDAQEVEKYGEGSVVCVRATVESADGVIQWPESLKGQKYTQ